MELNHKDAKEILSNKSLRFRSDASSLPDRRSFVCFGMKNMQSGPVDKVFLAITFFALMLGVIVLLKMRG